MANLLPKRKYYVAWTQPNGEIVGPIEWTDEEYQVYEYVAVLLQEGNNNVTVSF